MFIGSSIRKLKMYIANEIKNGDMEYTKMEMKTKVFQNK